MYEINAFIAHLIDDTKTGIIHWSIVGSWGHDPCSLDLREENPVLNELTSNNPFAYQHWSNMFSANVMSGFVYLSKHANIPPLYKIYIQLDSHSKISMLNSTSKDLQNLYEAISNQLTINNCEIINFIDQYNNSHFLENE